ncbi:hypothetical protein H0N95_00535 [Candidatus Micrarchaeota archaeon]|nr:hypothetical protein [Candidatus Micrarchaeota archaeon]
MYEMNRDKGTLMKFELIINDLRDIYKTRGNEKHRQKFLEELNEIEKTMKNNEFDLIKELKRKNKTYSEDVLESIALMILE